MLRTSIDGSTVPQRVGDPENQVPGLELPFATEDRAVGVRFYRPKDSFFLPNLLLQGIVYTANRITLQYPGEDVVIEGRGLHGLYVALARQSVVWIVQQGERGRAATCILAIDRQPKAESGEGPRSASKD